MRPISTAKLITILLIIVLLSRLDTVFAFATSIYHFFADVFHDMPPVGQLVNALLIFALVYITIVRILCNRR